MQMTTQHPIFSLTRSELMRFRQPALLGRLSQSELELLMLAAFNATELVLWQAAAVSPLPRPSLAPSVLPDLFDILEFSLTCPGWPHSQHAYFPQCLISADNANMEIIATCCQEWLACIADYHQGYAADRQRQKDAEKLNFLAHMRAFSSRKPTRYLRALSRYVISCIPIKAFYQYAAIGLSANHATYVIEYCGLAATLDSSPETPITKAQILALQDIILEHCSLDNQYIWQAQKALEQLLSEQGFNAFGASRLSDDEDNAERDALIADTIALQLGPRPASFIDGMAYDAKAITLRNQLILEMEKGQ